MLLIVVSHSIASGSSLIVKTNLWEMPRSPTPNFSTDFLRNFDQVI